ncbi:AIR synthase-related protein, partial [Candidatus Microgenomates bacterium]|nr:AIR synthase-related protein [Candidatus Microgenomates bacterium]
IKKATEEISGKKPNFCVSVFTDNSGSIAFDQNFIITHKVETHNSPSALDPFGGSITGIVGVNRDTIGFGLGAKPIANYYGFCFADPRVDVPLYKGPQFTQKMLSSRRIMDGVIEGVNAGGNQSGIPTPQGFVYFDEKYRGKPLVFVGTVGLIPKKIKNRLSYFKKSQNGDYIVMIGGRVGKDGIHGATFSSEAMDAGSPMTAVQIGDPITQKKLSDAVVKEARDQLLYHSITDNGAGGLSCSVAEMAKESGGCTVDLDKIPLKYPGMQPWEIWISESQERMTLAVPPKNWPKFKDLMERRGVESTVIGKFNHSGKCLVRYNGKVVMDIKMQFLHYGLPTRPLKSVNLQPKDGGQSIFSQKDLTEVFIKTLGNLNIADYSFISRQYDHTVQGGLVLPPLQGRGQVNGEASVIRPLFKSSRGLVLSQGLYPSYSDIDAYRMSAACIDTAFRNVIAAGANPGKIALLDNFCWCSGNDGERLGQLKQAAQACYDYALYYQAPFVSGKDSMFNDFAGFDKEGKPVKISIPPTLLITSMGIIDDIAGAVSLDFKFPGDLVYLLGETYDEFGTIVPNVDAKRNLKLYQSLFLAIQKRFLTSSIGVNRGGLAVALAKASMGGMLGIEISLKNIPGKVAGDYHALFSESQGRILVSINPKNKKNFEKIFKANSFLCIGKVSTDKKITIKGLKENMVVKTEVDKALKAYRKTFAGY